MAMATQECLRAVGDYSDVWKGFLERGVTHYSGAPTVQLSIASHPLRRKLHPVVNTTIAGAAPTATLIEGWSIPRIKRCLNNTEFLAPKCLGLENTGINVTHVYGLTGEQTVDFFREPY